MTAHQVLVVLATASGVLAGASALAEADCSMRALRESSGVDFVQELPTDASAAAVETAPVEDAMYSTARWIEHALVPSLLPAKEVGEHHFKVMVPYIESGDIECVYSTWEAANQRIEAFSTSRQLGFGFTPLPEGDTTPSSAEDPAILVREFTRARISKGDILTKYAEVQQSADSGAFVFVIPSPERRNEFSAALKDSGVKDPLVFRWLEEMAIYTDGRAYLVILPKHGLTPSVYPEGLSWFSPPGVPLVRRLAPALTPIPPMSTFDSGKPIPPEIEHTLLAPPPARTPYPPGSFEARLVEQQEELASIPDVSLRLKRADEMVDAMPEISSYQWNKLLASLGSVGAESAVLGYSGKLQFSLGPLPDAETILQYCRNEYPDALKSERVRGRILKLIDGEARLALFHDPGAQLVSGDLRAFGILSAVGELSEEAVIGRIEAATGVPGAEELLGGADAALTVIGSDHALAVRAKIRPRLQEANQKSAGRLLH